MIKHSYKNPKKYSENNSLQYNFAMKMLEKVIFSNTSRILDVGCGDGLITFEMAKLVPHGCVIGSDISKQMIHHATNSYENQENLRFLQMDASRNFFLDQFDIITSFNCLHWVIDQRAALKGIARAASKDSQIVLLFSHRKSLYHDVLEIICSKEKWYPFFKDFVNPRSFFLIDEYKQISEESGLQIIDISEAEMTYFFKTETQLQDFFSAAGCQINRIPEEHKQDFLKDFSKEFINQSKIDEEELIPVSFWCLQVVAKKNPAYQIVLEDQNNTLEQQCCF